MRTKSLLISFVLGLGLALGLLWVLNAPGVGLPVARAADLTVCTEGPPACDYATIQAAVDAARKGDVIKVAAGTYTDLNVRPRHDVTTTGTVTQVLYISKTVTVRGGYTTTNGFADPPDPLANPTTLDAGGGGRVLYITGAISPTVEGLRITGGNDHGQGGGEYYPASGFDDYGGGVYVITATVTISNSQVLDNTGGDGGGLCLVNSDAALSNNAVVSNTATSSGGGLCLVDSDATLSGDNVIRNAAGGLGGGLALWRGDATLSNNTFISNTAGEGGGLFMDGGGATLTNNVIADNQADSGGSGLYISYHAYPRLLHTTIARNTGGDNSGVYIADGSAVALTNTILVSHTVGVIVTIGNTVTLVSTLWAGGTPWANVQNWGGAGMVISSSHVMTGDPAFVDPSSGDYHIGPGSAAKDRGVDAGVTTDIDGDVRLGVPDLGADEYVLHVYLPLVLRNLQ
jgi:hypothetical protein